MKRQYAKLKWHFVERKDSLELRTTIEAHFAALGALYPKLNCEYRNLYFSDCRWWIKADFETSNVLEFHESKSVERVVEILRAVNANSDGIRKISSISAHLELQQNYSGILLTLDPILVFD